MLWPLRSLPCNQSFLLLFYLSSVLCSSDLLFPYCFLSLFWLSLFCSFLFLAFSFRSSLFVLPSYVLLSFCFSFLIFLFFPYYVLFFINFSSSVISFLHPFLPSTIKYRILSPPYPSFSGMVFMYTFLPWLLLTFVPNCANSWLESCAFTAGFVWHGGGGGGGGGEATWNQNR